MTQAVHAVAALESEYRPAPQFAHSVSPAVASAPNVPAAHAVQLIDNTEEA